MNKFKQNLSVNDIPIVMLLANALYIISRITIFIIIIINK